MNLKQYIPLFFAVFAFAQQKQVETTINTTKNKIGAAFELTLKTNTAKTDKVIFPKDKTIGAFEVIDSYPVDTIKKDDKLQLVKKYALIQFDSGKYTIPSVKILINNQPVLSDSVAVEVANVEVDTLKQKIYDIKPIIETKAPSNWWKYALILLLLAGIGTLVYRFIKNKQNKKTEEEVYKTPIEKATSLLNNLEKKELWQKGEIKTYYSELTFIARNYIEEAIEIPAMESTTSELIEGLKEASKKKKMQVSKETIENLERVLKQADLVKFAKSKPLEFEIAEDRNKIQKAILTLDNAIPNEVNKAEDDLLNEALRQKQLQIQQKKKKRKRIVITTAIAFGTLFLVTTVLIITKGFDYLKDNILGHPTKELLEGEWIKSEYGNPAIRIETPKVLMRTDISKTINPEVAALLKDMQTFTYGSFLSNFMIMINTYNYKQDTNIDLSKSLELTVQFIQMQGAQNMIVKQEDFETQLGIKGIKGYGSFVSLNSTTKKTSKIYYQILLFGQNGGLQQIIILNEEGDTYADQITDRVLNSVELKQANK